MITKKSASDQNISFMEDFMSPRQIRRLEKKAQRQLHGEKLLANDAIERYEHSKFQLLPKTQGQAELIYGMENFQQVLVFGPAGTGKTYVMAAHAAMMFQRKKIKKIVITRPNVPTGRTLGLFPGSVDEKMMVWVQPVVAVLKEVLGDEVFEIAMKKKQIILQPIETIRGMSFDDAFVIVDETQNIQVEEIKALVTRIGENTTLVLNGDIAQKDIREDSGLQFAIDTINKNEELAEQTYIVEFDVDDIVRSKLCKLWIKAFN